jgi:predicted nucleic acid-binding protein
LNTHRIVMIPTTQQDFKEAWMLFQTDITKRLSFTDCTLLSIARRLSIDAIFTHDSHFDGILTRVS